MPVYRYKGRDAQGVLVQGNLEAKSSEQLARTLGEQQITPIQIQLDSSQQAKPGDISLSDLPWLQRVSLDELILLSRQMYSLSRAGVPITQAIRGLALSVQNRKLSSTLSAVADELEQGVTLSGCLHKHSDVFSSLYVSVIHVGENSGQLDQAFLRVSQYLELERDTVKNLKTATRYPLFVITVIGLALLIVNLFVIPAFADMFAKLNAELPWQTRLLIGISDFIRHYWYLIFAGFGLALYGWHRYKNSEQGGLRWDRVKLRLPIVGGLFKRITLGRFSRMFALALRSGIPIEQGLSIVSDAVGNSYVAQQVRGMRSGIERGESFTQTAHHAAMFTPLVMQMIAVGEETGQIDEMLEQTADFYEQEVEYDLKGLASAIEPLLIICIASMVLVLALGVFLPLWEVSGAINR